jgi:hypothetical protein
MNIFTLWQRLCQGATRAWVIAEKDMRLYYLDFGQR